MHIHTHIRTYTNTQHTQHVCVYNMRVLCAWVCVCMCACVCVCEAILFRQLVNWGEPERAP